MSYQILTSGLLAVTLLGAAALLLSLSLIYKYHARTAELVAKAELLVTETEVLTADCQQLIVEASNVYQHGWDDCTAEWQDKVLWQDGYATCAREHGIELEHSVNS